MNFLPRPGELWEQKRGALKGRMGAVIYFDFDGRRRVTIAPMPGTCSCPRRQRRTTIGLSRFLAEWQPRIP